MPSASSGRIRARASRCGGGLVLLLLAGLAAPATAATNPAPIAVPLLGGGGVGSPYPSTINLTALGGPSQTGQVQIVLHNVTHPCPEQMAVLLTHAGSGYLLMANAGGCRPMQGTDIVFSTLAGGAIPDNDASPTPWGPSVTTFPAVYGATPTFPAPAPGGPYSSSLPSASTNLNGAWNLYVIDQVAGTRGVIASGWTINHPSTFETTSSPASVAIPNVGAAPSVTFDLTAVPTTTLVRAIQLRLQFTHAYPADLEILLQSPSGTSVIVMNDAGSSTPVTNVDLTFSDAAAATVTTAPLVSGTYRPGGSFGAVLAPSPSPPHATAFSAFAGQQARGTWRLWINDDEAPDGGTLLSATLTVLTEFTTPLFSIDTPTSASSSSTTRPFLRVAGEIEELSTPHSATWRNVVNGTYYASGPMRIPTTGDVIQADVPMKQGTNVITVSVRNTRGTSAVTDTITVTVSEFDYYLTEGATGGFFDMDIGLLNPEALAAPVALTFLPEGGSPIAHGDTVAGGSPLVLHGDDFVAASGVATVVRSTEAKPLAVERSMFWDASYYGGHGGTAVDGASTRWLFAEGSQGFFDTFLLLANDNAATVTTTIRFLREGTTPVVITPSIAPHTRLTIYAGLVTGLPGTSFGIDVTASQPITAERAMYFRAAVHARSKAGTNRPASRRRAARGFSRKGRRGPSSSATCSSAIRIRRPRACSSRICSRAARPSSGTPRLPPTRG